MLRKPFVSTRQPSTSRFGPRRLAFSYPHARLSQAEERTRGIHTDGRRSVRMRSPAWSGRIGSWLERAMSLRRAGTFSPVHAVFSHAPETCSMAFLTAWRQSHHNTAEHCGNTRKTVLEGVFEGYIPSLSENRRERHSRQPLEHHRPKRPQPYCQKGWKPKLLRLGLNQ